VTVPHLTPALRASSAAAAFAALRAQGLRLSTARRLLLQALYDADRPMSADQLAGGGDVASAYRNLEVLEELGLVRHVHLGHGAGRYQPASARHEFVICEGCGAFETVAPQVLDEVRSAVLAATGYRARFTHSPLAGLCPDCSVDHHHHEERSHAHS
jgi:Fur family ferric uptake transcriptional regulator